ncbi:hypothetical protein J2S74_005279 [Evansella vedderi]|uniref:YaaC-like Protein n=1 Tax=Evansella vedderi TaxID=38282 RepID=A0ABU0A482_9BACI|nr:YaaC family protein [Evansella vedderi]MDQ0257817.1 hypothetical protein [Evansella vedderi]
MYEKNKFTILFQSVEYVKHFLQKKYEEKGIGSPNELAFQNSYAFVYYIKLGESYFSQGVEAPTEIKPVLFFYGLSHWLKGALLTVDPEYPATTQVLAHGVSARKRKKQGYRFLSDEIKVQKDGFFPYLSNHFFSVKQLTGEKYKMKHLLMSIPEMNSTFEKLEKEAPLLPIKKNENYPEYIVSLDLLKKLRMSPKRLEMLVKEKTGSIITCLEQGDQISIKIEKEGSSLPFFHSREGRLYMSTVLPIYWNLPEILSHFLLLYNLSMICRYEAEWWGEVLYSFSSNDLPFIDTFLWCVQEKTPLLVERLFFDD